MVEYTKQFTKDEARQFIVEIYNMIGEMLKSYPYTAIWWQHSKELADTLKREFQLEFCKHCGGIYDKNELNIDREENEYYCNKCFDT